jgi:ACT domain-containing protein
MNEHELKNAARMITRLVEQRLGNVNPQLQEAISREVLAALGENGPRSAGSSLGSATNAMASSSAQHSLDICAACQDQQQGKSRQQAVITCTGRNHRGVIAKISAQIAAGGGDIMDVSQTLVGGFFTMILIADIEDLNITFAEFKERIIAAAKELGIHAVVMHEEVMKALQRI